MCSQIICLWIRFVGTALGEMLLLDIHNITEKIFFNNTIVHRTQDAWGDIMVIDRGSCRVLAFDPIYEQSSVDLKNPHIPVHEYMRVMILVFAFIQPRHVTIFGLGGGCLVHCLHHLFPTCTLHSIELRQKVYDVAIDFFRAPIKNNITVTIADAKLAITRCENKSTQIIFSDLYHAFGMNPFQIQKKFIHHCHRILDDTGWLVVNYHQLPELNSGFIRCLRRYFAEIFVCPSQGGNFILFASKKPVGNTNRQQATISELEKSLNIKLAQLFMQFKRINI